MQLAASQTNGRLHTVQVALALHSDGTDNPQGRVHKKNRGPRPVACNPLFLLVADTRIKLVHAQSPERFDVKSICYQEMDIC